MLSITQADANGSFDLAGVVPGSYLLLAYNDKSRARITIDVGDRDIENIAVVMAPPFNLTGRFIFDGPTLPGTDLHRNPLFLTFTAEPAIVGTNVPGGTGFA